MSINNGNNFEHRRGDEGMFGGNEEGSTENSGNFNDRTLKCEDCSEEFVFTAGEQEFYSKKGFRNDPKRCNSCRSARKNSRDGRSSRQTPHQMYSAVCAKCHNPAEVPFDPIDGRPVYCSACFEEVQQQRKDER